MLDAIVSALHDHEPCTATRWYFGELVSRRWRDWACCTGKEETLVDLAKEAEIWSRKVVRSRRSGILRSAKEKLYSGNTVMACATTQADKDLHNAASSRDDGRRLQKELRVLIRHLTRESLDNNHGSPDGTEGKSEGFLKRSRSRFALSALRIFSKRIW